MGFQKRIYFFCILTILSSLPGSKCNSVEKRLMSNLLGKYDNIVRPVSNVSEPVTVKFGLSIFQILKLDESQDTLKSVMWRTLKWNDPGLSWSPSEYKNVTYTQIPQDRIWIPDIVVYNSVMEEFEPKFQTNAVISSDGNVTLVCPGIHETACEISYHNFPFDEQNCTIKLESWSFVGNKMDLQLLDNTGEMYNFLPNPDWKLIAFPAVRNVMYYTCCEEPYVSIRFTVHLKRRGEAIVEDAKEQNLFILSTLILSFLIPPTSCHKLTLGMLSVYYSWSPIWYYLAEFPHLIQRSTDGGGPLVYYLKVMRVFAVVAIFANILTVWLYYSLGRMPQWIRKPLMSNFTSSFLMNPDFLKETENGKPGKASEPRHFGIELMFDVNDWKFLALVLDRLFFLIFPVTGIIIWIACFPY